MKNEVEGFESKQSIVLSEFSEVIDLIKHARERAVRIVNTELIELYWQVGEFISRKVNDEGWGSGVVMNLAAYLNAKEPDLKGFSAQNMWRMKQFFETYRDHEKLSPVVREISWTHNIIILAKAKTLEEKEFYIRLCASERYSKRELERQIDSALFELTVFSKAKLSPPVRQLPKEVSSLLRDNYVLDFLNLPEPFSENDLRKGIVKNLKNFIVEAGKDFCFVGEEYRLSVGNTDFYIDLLFFHRGLSCLVAFELKITDFKPEYLGKLDFYLEALDRNVKKVHEKPSVGVILCKSKDEEIVEYALSRNLSPAMVAEYQTQLPDREILRMKLQELFELSESAAAEGEKNAK